MKKLIFALMLLCCAGASAQRTEIADSLRPPQRLTWNGERGVFLNTKQEELTLEKLQWKDVYKNDAITFYMVSLQLNNRVHDLETLVEAQKADLNKCEAEAVDRTEKMLDYQKRWDDEKSANAVLKDEKFVLKKKLTKSIALNVGLGAALVGTGVYILTK